MDTLVQIYHEATHPVNLLFTAGLAAVVLYWVLVIFGCFGGEEGDADVHADLSAAGGELDLHAEAGDVGLHADADGDAGHASFGDHGGAHGGTQWLLRFLHVGDAPLMPLLSLMALCLWVGALLANHRFNPGYAWGTALLLLLPNVALAALVTHFLAYPVTTVFRAMNRDAAAPAPIAGSVCRILTSTADAQFGEAVIERSGAPLQIHVRTGGEVLRQGERAFVIRETEEPGTYQITSFDPQAIAEIQKQAKDL